MEAERIINKIVGLIVLLPIAGIIAVAIVISLSLLFGEEKSPSIISAVTMVIGFKIVYMSENVGKKVRKFFKEKVLKVFKEKVHNGLLKNFSEETKTLIYVMVPASLFLIFSFVMILVSIPAGD